MWDIEQNTHTALVLSLLGSLALTELLSKQGRTPIHH